ncbi:MAG: DUF3329 domain-containing protein [Devosia sp.]
MALNKSDSDFFRPMWRRVLVTAIVAAWFGYESLFTHEQMWIGITGVAVVYCVWNFFLRYPKDPPVAAPDQTPPAEPPKA